MKNYIDVFIGNEMRKAREQNGWSTRDAAKRIGMAHMTYYCYETGEHSMHYSTLMKICDFYGFDLGDLFERAKSIYDQHKLGEEDGSWEK